MQEKLEETVYFGFDRSYFYLQMRQVLSLLAVMIVLPSYENVVLKISCVCPSRVCIRRPVWAHQILVRYIDREIVLCKKPGIVINRSSKQAIAARAEDDSGYFIFRMIVKISSLPLCVDVEASYFSIYSASSRQRPGQVESHVENFIFKVLKNR